MTDVKKQRAFVKNKRNSRTKLVKRSVRARMGAIENVTVTLVGELRTMLKAIEDKHQEQTILTTLLAKAQQGQELTAEDHAVVQDYLSTYEVKQTPSPEPAPAAE